MAKIRDLLADRPTYSFEFFPPKTDEAKVRLEKTIQELEPLAPTFASVTYGAGGSTRSSTRDVVIGIETDTSMTSMAHLTCVGHSRAEIVDILNGYEDAGVENVLALAGDPQRGGPVGEFTFATELVGLIRQTGSFSIGVAAHPEGHPRSVDLRSDRRRLAEKLEMADFAITQFFFRASSYHHMMGELAGLGCEKPVLPGIMPVTSLSQVERFAQLSGAEFPVEVAARLEAADGPDEVRKIGIDIATTMCQELLDAGAPGLHFYTLNQSTATREIYRNLGLAPETAG